MPHRHNSENSLFAKILHSIPIAGHFFYNEEPIKVAIKGAAYDATAITGQLVGMYAFSMKLMGSFSALPMDPMTEMMLVMALSMEIGDPGAKVLFKIGESFVNFELGNKDISLPLKLAQLIPIVGPFLKDNKWQEAVPNGIRENIHHWSMLAVSTIVMMHSPGGMEVDPASISITSSLMIASMAATHMSLTLMEEVLKKSIGYLSKLSLLCRKQEPNVVTDNSPLLEAGRLQPT